MDSHIKRSIPALFFFEATSRGGSLMRRSSCLLLWTRLVRCVLSLGLSFPRPFDDNSHDGMKGETKLVHVFFFFFCRVSFWVSCVPLGPLLGPERSLFGGKFSYVGGYGEKEIRNGELGACKEFLSEFARDAPTRRRSHPRLKALFGASA